MKSNAKVFGYVTFKNTRNISISICMAYFVFNSKRIFRDLKRSKTLQQVRI